MFWEHSAAFQTTNGGGILRMKNIVCRQWLLWAAVYASSFQSSKDLSLSSPINKYWVSYYIVATAWTLFRTRSSYNSYNSGAAVVWGCVLLDTVAKAGMVQTQRVNITGWITETWIKSDVFEQTLFLFQREILSESMAGCGGLVVRFVSFSEQNLVNSCSIKELKVQCLLAAYIQELAFLNNNLCIIWTL